MFLFSLGSDTVVFDYIQFSKFHTYNGDDTLPDTVVFDYIQFSKFLFSVPFLFTDSAFFIFSVNYDNKIVHQRA